VRRTVCTISPTAESSSVWSYPFNLILINCPPIMAHPLNSLLGKVLNKNPKIT
jgi:hypothetical protein